MVFRSLIVAICLLLVAIVGCTKNDKNKKWNQYEYGVSAFPKHENDFEYMKPRIPPIIGDVPVVHNPINNVPVQMIISNEQMRKAAHSSVVGLTPATWVKSDQEIFWVGKYNSVPKVLEKSREDKRIGKGNIQTAFPLFSWTHKNGVKLLAEDMDFFNPFSVVENPLDLKNCSKGSPVVMGIESLGHLFIEGEKGTAAIPGFPISKGVCFEKCSGNGKCSSKEIFKLSLTDRQFIGEFGLNLKSGRVYFPSTGFEKLKDMEHEGKKYPIFDPSELFYRIESVDLTTGKTEILFEIRLRRGDTPVPIPMYDIEISEEGARFRAVGIEKDRKGIVYCEGKTKPKNIQRPAPGKCEFIGSQMDFAFSLDASNFFSDDILRWGTTLTKVESEKFARMGQVWECKLKRTKGFLDCPEIKQRKKLAAPFYGVIGLQRYENELFVFDFVEQSAKSNNIFSILFQQFKNEGR